MSENIPQEPYNPLDFDDAPELLEQPSVDAGSHWFPSTVTVAGLIWVILGCLLILIWLLQLGSAVIHLLTNNGGQGDAFSPTSLCAFFTNLIIGLAFLVGGIRCIRGTAGDTVGIAIGSVVFSVPEWCVALGLAFWGQFIFAGFFSLIAALLLASGVLGLIGRRRYKLWLNSHRSRRFQSLD